MMSCVVKFSTMKDPTPAKRAGYELCSCGLHLKRIEAHGCHRCHDELSKLDWTHMPF